MRKSFLSTKTALSLVLSFILPLQMLATELGEAGKRLAALPGVSNVKSHATFKMIRNCGLSMYNADTTPIQRRNA